MFSKVTVTASSTACATTGRREISSACRCFPGIAISIPGSEDFIYLAATTGPLSLALGLAVYEDERYPDYWVFGNKSESAMKSMIPGADDSTRVSLQAVSATEPLNPTDALYREQLVFSGSEEKQAAREPRVGG